MIRAAYPDELGRAQSLLQGQPLAPGTRFLLSIKEHPVERIIAAIPWSKSAAEDQSIDLKFSIHSSNSRGLLGAELDDLFIALEALAKEEKASTLTADFPLVEEHPLYKKLSARGYEIFQTDTYISAPGDEVKALFLSQKNKVSTDWKIESIRDRSPESFYPLIAVEGSLTPKQFKAYWDGSSRERFEEDFSHLILAGEEEKVIGILLATLHSNIGLNIRIESICKDHSDQAELISNILHQAAFLNCPDNFPQVITWSSKTNSSYQGGNVQSPRHILKKFLVSDPSI